mmetsp:Transcript_67343/g.106052  ORF Transcript_67343/g.106052 Transcript_67343/m.106052 type:complete len:213 (-) Transcript_67343:52-690(-)
MRAARFLSTSAARAATSRTKSDASGLLASSSRRFATRRSRVDPKRRDSVPMRGSRRRNRDSGSPNWSSKGPAFVCTVSKAGGNVGRIPEISGLFGNVSADLASLSVAPGFNFSHNALKFCKDSLSVWPRLVSDGIKRESSSKAIAGVMAASTTFFRKPGNGNLPTVESANCFGARNASARAFKGADSPTWAMESRTDASTSLAASSKSNSWT